ncbi:MAG: CDP-glycerol glycerophosphotransferase family protein [Deltaproteobacteria bacterium]|jgi:hypothetical protein|nr:CDP-glycerol glycerophosphotransferase family protein [Deltaproteobacteria bacterium]
MQTTRTVLFTGYAPVHFECFRPLYKRFVEAGIEVFVSGGLRTHTENGKVYDEHGLYNRYGLAPDSILSLDEIRERDFDFLFGANTKILSPRTTGTKVQIFHGISFRNCAVRAENSEHDFYFVVGSYMHRKFIESGIFPPDDPRALKIGFMKTDRLLNGELDRQNLLQQYGFEGNRPVLLYAPTGAIHNSLETMGEEVIKRVSATSEYDLLIKLHDHPKDTSVDWTERLAFFEDAHTRIVHDFDVIPLLFLADMLITDASSVSNEYSLLNRPILFLDVPELIENAKNANGRMVDLDTWGRRCGVLVKQAEDIVHAVDDSLSYPEQFSDIRKAMATDLFYNPGCATEKALHWFRTGTEYNDSFTKKY